MKWVLIAFLFYSPGGQPLREMVTTTSVEFNTQDACNEARNKLGAIIGLPQWRAYSYAECYAKGETTEEIKLQSQTNPEVMRGFPTAER
jgi:hypothetical protein